MHTESIELDRVKARELWRDYRKHQHWSEPIDQDVMRGYQAIAQGKVVIRALESIRTAGLDAKGLPLLAIARGDAAQCWCMVHRDGDVTFATQRERLYYAREDSRQVIKLQRGTFARGSSVSGASLVPQIPLPLRPKRGLANYHVLFEADWTLAPPIDPMLLRRIGKTDLWVVCAAWELTPIEAAALAARLHV
jgi:hypothetical protein